MRQNDALMPPYLPFKTFQTAIEILSVGLPEQIDRTVFKSLAGNVQGDVLRAFRFLGLINEAGQIQPSLQRLVEDADKGKSVLREILVNGYSELVSSIDLAKATPQQLDEAMRKYGVHGATHRKALTFFLQAAQFAEIPLSKYLAAKIRLRRSKANGGPARRRTQKATPVRNMPIARGGKTRTEETTSTTVGTQTRTVQLSKDGQLVLSVAANMLSLPSAERQLISELIERLDRYEQGRSNENRPEGSGE